MLWITADMLWIMAVNVTGIMAENVEYNGTGLISEVLIANGFVCCGKAGQDD